MKDIEGRAAGLALANMNLEVFCYTSRNRGRASDGPPAMRAFGTSAST
jgi:hypothetical protein